MSARVRTALPLLLLLGAVLAVAVLAGPGRDGLPLDPRSTAADGTKALVDSLRAIGADVGVVTAPRERDDVVLLLSDVLGEEHREALVEWVEAGGRLVVADGTSPLTPQPVAGASLAGFVQAPIERGCAVAALASVAEVNPGSPSVVYAGTGSDGVCFPRNDGHWLVVSERGRGVVVALGGPEVLTNAQLGTADHGLLAAALLAPEPGTRVAFLRPPLPGDGEASLADLLDPRVRSALWQLLVAFVVLALWRVRRLGRPLEEPRTVHIPGSELVVAVGNLLQQARATERAAGLLRTDLRRHMALRFGLPASTPPERVAEVASQRTGIDAGEAHRVLAGPLPRDEDGMVALARSAERLRSALTDGRQPVRAAGNRRGEPASELREGMQGG